MGSLPCACKAKGLESGPGGRSEIAKVIRGIVKALHRPRQREIRGQRTRLRGKLRRGRRSLVAPQVAAATGGGTPNAQCWSRRRRPEESTQPVTQHELLADFSLELGIQAREQFFAAVAIHCR